MVGCLLASPRYGERMAMGWLDHVRDVNTKTTATEKFTEHVFIHRVWLHVFGNCIVKARDDFLSRKN